MSLNMWDMTDDEQEMLKQLTQPQLQEPPNKRPRTSGSSSVPEIDPMVGTYTEEAGSSSGPEKKEDGKDIKEKMAAAKPQGKCTMTVESKEGDGEGIAEADGVREEKGEALVMGSAMAMDVQTQNQTAEHGEKETEKDNKEEKTDKENEGDMQQEEVDITMNGGDEEDVKQQDTMADKHSGVLETKDKKESDGEPREGKEEQEGKESDGEPWEGEEKKNKKESDGEPQEGEEKTEGKESDGEPWEGEDKNKKKESGGEPQDGEVKQQDAVTDKCSGVLETKNNKASNGEAQEGEEKNEEQGKGKDKRVTSGLTFAGRVAPTDPKLNAFFFALKTNYENFVKGVKNRSQPEYWVWMRNRCDENSSDDHITKSAKRYASHGSVAMLKKPAAAQEVDLQCSGVPEEEEKGFNSSPVEEVNSQCSGVPEEDEGNEVQKEVLEEEKEEVKEDEEEENGEEDEEKEVKDENQNDNEAKNEDIKI